MTEERAHVAVRQLFGPDLAELGLTVIGDESHLDNVITHPRVQKPGLAFAGYYKYIKSGRVQIVGESEMAYLATLDDDTRLERFTHITGLEIPVFVITKGIEPFPEFVELCDRNAIPLVRSPALSSVVIKEISYYLEEHLVPSTTIHGVLVDIYGMGVMLIGGSGVGKSECALDLITRGHSLVADDRVTIRRYPHGDLIGYCEEPLRHHMELRGLGIINVQDLFGLAAVRERRSIDLVVELEHWDESKSYDRLGLDETVFKILDIPCPYIKMPVALGRNVSGLVEIAARNHLLKLRGHHSAREFAKQLEQRLELGRQPRPRKRG
ncbi:MAG: HPr(Ser) kinase/phosphatase [Acidobacteriota bacterium]